MHKFVEGIKIMESMTPMPFISHMIDDQVAIMCQTFPLKSEHCKTCQKQIPKDKKQKLMELGFSIVDNKCYITYDFNKNNSNNNG